MARLELGVADSFYAVTPSLDNLPTPCRALYIGTTGDVNVIPYAEGADPVLFVGVPAGATLYVSARAVSNVDTSASNIVALI